MKLRTKVGSLLDTLTLTSPTLDHKGSSSNLYLESNNKSGFLYLYSTNLIAETSTKIKAEVEATGKALINPKKLADGLAGISKDDPVSLNLVGNILRIVSGSVKFSLASSADVEQLSAKMRTIPSKSDPISVIPTVEISEFTKRSQFCIPNDQTGNLANLAALKISDTPENEEAFATDGTIAVHVSTKKYIGKKTYPGLGLGGILLPAQTLQALSTLSKKKKGETVSVIMTEKKNKVYFKFADDTYYGVLTMSCQYPNLRGVMDQKPTYEFEIPRKMLTLTLGRANAFVASNLSKKILEIELSGDSMNIKANGDDPLSDSIGITYKGAKPSSPVKLGINISHLMDIAAGSESEHLSFGFSKENEPMVVTDQQGEDDEAINVKYVVMGARLSK